MCECNCADVVGDVVQKAGDVVVCVDAYPGCRECGGDFGFFVRLFTPLGAIDFLDTDIFSTAKVDEYGGDNTFFEMFNVDDLVAAAEGADIDGIAAYSTAEEWVKANALELIRAAYVRCQERKRKAAKSGD
jgi:hypothetical protein